MIIYCLYITAFIFIIVSRLQQHVPRIFLRIANYNHPSTATPKGADFEVAKMLTRK
jgi:hypothetical protein